MPKKSKKSKSKRMTLKQKYKIIRKVKEHHRKIRKEERKAAKNGTKKKKVVKDPGLPSQWPYKEELVKEFAFLRAKALADEKQKKEERKLARQACNAACRDSTMFLRPGTMTVPFHSVAAAAIRQTAAAPTLYSLFHDP